jgi:hypothetical protein
MEFQAHARCWWTIALPSGVQRNVFNRCWW